MYVGNWLELNELPSATNNIDQLYIEVLLIDTTAGATTATWQESLICQGILTSAHYLTSLSNTHHTSSSKNTNKLINGFYETKLSTYIHHCSRSIGSNSLQEVKVGKIRFKLIFDHGKLHLDIKVKSTENVTSWILRHLEMLAQSSDPFQKKLTRAIYILSKVDVHDQNHLTLNLQLMDRLLHLIVSWKQIWSASMLQDMVGIIVQLQLPSVIASSLGVYFEVITCTPACCILYASCRIPWIC
jgi:hypothetical protein